jgi:hypothetical protein
VEQLSLTLQTAYAELVEQLVTADATRSIGSVPGSFVTKEVKGSTYYYFQFSTPGGSTRQIYIGLRTRELEAVVARYRGEREALRSDRERVAELCAMLRAGATVTDAGAARIIGALANTGVFKLGGVLVGTHAFVVLGNVLGVRWTGLHARTDDVDIATERSLQIAVPDVRASVPEALDSLGMGFLPVPSFSPKEPSTSFSVRGRALRLDLLTPAKSRKPGPIRIARFDAAAAPLSFLELLLEDAIPAAVVDGGGILVRVPHPARFTIHKLIVAHRRSAAFQTKREKDLAQAAQLVEVLEELRPGELRAAWKAARRKGPGWARGLDGGLSLLRARHRSAGARLASAVH